MKPIQHPSNNDVLLPPPNSLRDRCRALPITRVMFGDEGAPDAIPGVISYWQPSQEELALINQGKPIYLSCVGVTHPPVFVGVSP